VYNLRLYLSLETCPLRLDHDPSLRRVERDAIVACAAMAIVAAAVARAPLAAAAGVIGGGAIVWVSYRGVKGGVDAIAGAAARGGARRSAAIGLVKFFTRYGILAALAYVIMARLGLPPVAVVAGASSLVIAIMVEALRSLRHNPPRHLD
jgi:hypothetical protein